MFFKPARRAIFVVLLYLSLLFSFGAVAANINPVFAQTPTPATQPTSNLATWEFDPIVTEVGKNADRARQLLWWLFQHPGVHTAPVIAQIWAFVRNIVLIFVVMVIIAFGMSLILGRRRGAVGPVFTGISSPVFGVNVPIIFIRIAGILLYVMFSYIIIVALIQTSDIIMRFFIEAVGGKDLFNIIFAGAGNTEANYITFVGYRDVNPLSQEMVNTSLFYIKLTSLTYNVMSTLLVLRTIILWFLLIIAPFLALLMPFVFIRNTGWIWIGVFFQWLFYGPIFALFLAALTRIWVAGIPYSFDFSRVNKPSGQVYRTAINILWGGPAQTLSPGNSANYVDTYAEYFIALVMLWAAIILPWMLLRIFRDYCCSMIAAGANTLNSIFDRLRQFPLPPPTLPLGPTSASGIAVELPFRQSVTEKVRDIQHVRIEEIKNVSNVSSNEIVRSMDMQVTKLSDISRMETNMMKKSEVNSYLDKIRQPDRITTNTEREKFKEVRQELVQRALKGDRVAQTLLQASDRQTMAMRNQILSTGVTTPIKITAAVPQETRATVPAITSRSVVEQVSNKSSISELRAKDVLTKISVEELSNISKVQEVSKSTGISAEKVKEIVQTADQAYKSSFKEQTQDIKQISQQTNLSETKTRDILSKISESDLSNISKVQEVAKQTGVSEETVREVVKSAERIQDVKEIVSQKDVMSQIATQNNITADKTTQIIQSISQSEITSAQKVSEIAKVTGVSEEKVKEVVKSAEQIRSQQTIQQIASQSNLSTEATTKIIQNISATELSNIEKVKEVAKLTGVSEEKVKEVVREAEKLKDVSSQQTIQQIATQSNLSTDATTKIIQNISATELTNTEKVKEVAKLTGVSEEKVKEVVKSAEQIKDVSSQTVIQQIATQSNLSTEATKQIMQSITENEVISAEKVKQVAKESGVSEESVKEVVKQATEIKTKQETEKKKQLAEKVSTEQNIKSETAQTVLDKVSEKDLTNTEKVKEVAKETGLTEEKVKEVVKAAEKAKQAVKKVSGPAGPVAQAPVSTAVSVEDYEEVKQMWLKHYRSSPVPITENIKNRTEWLSTEEKQLTNITNLLSSANPQLKQQGLDKVSDILPFMLLGGFSENEILTYIKAKLEADRQVIEETSIEEKAKEKAKEELKKEEEEVLVEVGKKEEAEKAETLAASQTIPEENEGEKKSNQAQENQNLNNKQSSATQSTNSGQDDKKSS